MSFALTVYWYCVRCWECGRSIIDEIENEHLRCSTRCATRLDAVNDLRFVQPIGHTIKRVSEVRRVPSINAT